MSFSPTSSSVNDHGKFSPDPLDGSLTTSNPTQNDLHKMINKLMSDLQLAFASVPDIDSDKALSLLKKRVQTLKNSFDNHLSKLGTQPLTSTEKIGNIWRSIDQKFNQLYADTLSSIEKIQDITPLENEFLEIQKIGQRIIELRNPIYMGKSCTLDLKVELEIELNKILDKLQSLLNKVKNFRFSSYKRESLEKDICTRIRVYLLIRKIHEAD